LSKFSQSFNDSHFWLYIYEKSSMKVVRFLVFLPILFVLSCSGESDKNLNNSSNQTLILTGKQQRDTVFLNFIIPEKKILAKRTGKLERLVENPEFKKNGLLVQFDNYDAFVELSGEKEALKEDLTNQLNNHLPESLKPVEKKWRDFAGKLTPDKIMPELPAFEYKEEAGFIEEAMIREKYIKIQKKEAAVQNYFQLSPEDGFILKAYAHTDEYVKKNQLLIAYHPKKINVRVESSFPLTRKIKKQITTNLFVRIPIDQAKLLRSTENEAVYKLTLNQKLDKRICPKYLLINQEQNVFSIPKEYIGKNGKVIILTESGPVEERVYSKHGKNRVFSKLHTLKIKKP
jgi:hypothetical protein